MEITLVHMSQLRDGIGTAAADSIVCQHGIGQTLAVTVYCVCYLKRMHTEGTNDHTGKPIDPPVPLVPWIKSVLFWRNVAHYVVVQHLQSQRSN